MKISVCGLSGSGKTYHAKRIAKEYGLEYVSGSEMLLSVAGLRTTIDLYWVSADAIQLEKRRLRDLTLDRIADELLLEMVKAKDGIVVDSWILPWLYKGSDLFRIYLDGNLAARARISYESRESKSYSHDELKSLIKRKDQVSAEIFNRLYGVDIFDTSIFNFVINNLDLTITEASDRIDAAIKSRFALLTK